VRQPQRREEQHRGAGDLQERQGGLTLRAIPGGAGRLQLNHHFRVHYNRLLKAASGERHPHEDAGEDCRQDVGDRLDVDETKGAL